MHDLILAWQNWGEGILDYLSNSNNICLYSQIDILIM